MKSFPGMFINGIQFMSPAYGVPIAVPKSNDLTHRIQVWEEAEEDMATGRVVDHDSGVLSGKPGHSKTNPANPFGFSGLMPGVPHSS